MVRSYLSSYAGLSKPCYRGFALNLIESVFFGIYYYLSIYFIDVLHLSVATSGWIISCYGIGAVCGGMLGGRLSDRFSPGKVSVSAMVVQAVTYFIFMNAHSVAWLMVNVFILGVASYAFITTNYLFVLDFCKGDDENRQRLKALNILATTSNLGLGLSALVINQMIHLGFEVTFFVAGSVLLILAAMFFAGAGHRLQSLQPSCADQSDDNKATEVVMTPAKRKIVMLTLLCVFGVGMIVAQIGSTYAVYVKDAYPLHGMNAVTSLFALNAFLVVIFGVPLGERIRKHNKVSMVGVGGLLIGFGMFMLLFSYSLPMAAVACTIYTIGEIIFFSVAQLVCYENGLQHQKGRALGTYRTIYASTRVFGPATGGVIYARFGGSAVWVVSGIIGFLSFVFCHYYKNLTQ